LSNPEKYRVFRLRILKAGFAFDLHKVSVTMPLHLSASRPISPSLNLGALLSETRLARVAPIFNFLKGELNEETISSYFNARSRGVGFGRMRH
jgi:hypothetical protein